MPYNASAGSGLVFSADKYGTAAAPTTDELQPWVGIAAGAAGALAPASGANPLPVRAGVTDLISVTLSLDTSAYASGDLLADAQEIAGALRVSGGAAKLVSLMVIDEDDQGAAFDVYVTSASTSWGTENSAPTVADAAARSIQAVVSVATADYKDLGGVQVACFKNIQAIVEGAASTSLYVAVVNGAGTPTFSASGVRLVFGFEQN